MAAGLPEGDPATWSLWCEEAGIFRGLDGADHRGTYVEGDLLHWEQGLKRLALGAFVGGGDRPVPVGARRYYPAGVEAGEEEACAIFLAFLQRLLGDVARARRERRTLAEWADFFAAYLAAYVHPADDDEEADLRRALRVVGRLREATFAATPVSYAAPAAFLRSRLGSEVLQRTEPLAEGVVVGPLETLRGVPFRSLYCLGLGQGVFPAPEPVSPLDLRRLQPGPDDVARREADRAAFLEVVLSARERLTLTYVDRDLLTGERLEPAAVVAELLDVMERRFGLGREALVGSQPLRRYALATASSGVIRSEAPEAYAEARARVVGESLRTHLGQGRIELQELEPELRERATRAAGVPLLLHPPQQARPSELEVPVSALEQFLTQPADGWLRFLGLTAPEEDPLLVEDEALGLDAYEEHVLLSEVLRRALRAGRDPMEVYGEAVAVREARGRFPLGVLGSSLRERHRLCLALLAKHLKRIGPLRVWWLGGPPEGEQAEKVLSPLRLAPAGRTVRLTGRLLLVGDPPRPLVLRPRWTRTEPRHWCRLLATAAVVAAAGKGGEDTQLVVGTPRGLEVPVAWRWRPGEARAYLEELVRSLVVETHDYLFDVDEALKRQDPAALRERLLARREDEHRAPRLAPAVRLRVLSAAEYESVLERRYGPILRAEAAGWRR